MTISMRISFRILLTICFCFIFLVTWMLPVLLIVLGGTDSASFNVGVWTYETVKLVAISIERQLKFSSANGESVRNFTRINNIPFTDNITHRSFVSRAIGEMLESPNWQQYFLYFRFRDGSSFAQFPLSSDIAQFQICRTNGFWNNSIGLPNTSAALQATEIVSDCLLYDLNRTDHTATPTTNYEYALARTYVNGPLWLGLAKAFTPPSPLVNASYYYLSPLYTPNRFQHMLVILGVALRMSDGTIRMVGSESLSIDNMRDILRGVLLPSVNDPRTRGYLLDPNGICIATTHEQPYDEFGNLTIPVLLQYSVTPLCFIEDTTRGAACFYNISTHPTLELLRLVGADQKNQKVHEGHAELILRPSDGAEYFWQHTMITYSAFVKFPLYIFIPRDWVMGAIDRSKIVSIVINVVLAGVGAALVYITLTPIVRVIEDLSEKLARDPFDPELAAEMENTVARLESKGEGHGGSSYAISSSSSLSDSNKFSDEFSSDDDERNNINGQQDDDAADVDRSRTQNESSSNNIKRAKNKEESKKPSDRQNKNRKQGRGVSLPKDSNSNEHESRKSTSSSAASSSHFSISFLGIVSCCNVDFIEILTLQTAFLEMRRVISLLRSFMPERRTGLELASSSNSTTSDLLAGGSNSSSVSDSSKARTNDNNDQNIPASPTRKMPPPLAHKNIDNENNDNNNNKPNSPQERVSATKEDPANKTGGSASTLEKKSNNKKAVRFDFGVSNTNDAAGSDAVPSVKPENNAVSVGDTKSGGAESETEANPMNVDDDNNEKNRQKKLAAKQGLEKFPKKKKKTSLNDFGANESAAPTHRYLVSVVRVRVPVMEYFDRYKNKRKSQDENGNPTASGDEPNNKNDDNNNIDDDDDDDDDDDYSSTTSDCDNDDNVNRETNSPKHPINDLEREHRQEKRLGHKLMRSDEDDNNNNNFDHAGALNPGDALAGSNLILTDSGNHLVSFSKKTKKERRLQALIDETMFAVRVIDKKVLQPTGASLIEYRNNFFIIALRLAKKNFHSRLASRFVECLMEASEILAKHYNKMESRKEERKRRRENKKKGRDPWQQRSVGDGVISRKNSNHKSTTSSPAAISHINNINNNNNGNHHDDDESNNNPMDDNATQSTQKTCDHTFVSDEETTFAGDETSNNELTENNNKGRSSSNLGKAAGLFLTAGISVGYARILSFDTNDNNSNANSDKNTASSIFTKEMFSAAGYDVSNEDDGGAGAEAAAAAFNRKNAALPLRPFTLVGNIVTKAFECERHIRKHVESFAAATPHELAALLAAQADNNKFSSIELVDILEGKKSLTLEKEKKASIQSSNETKDRDGTQPQQEASESLPHQQPQKESFTNASAASSDGPLVCIKKSSGKSGGGSSNATTTQTETSINDGNEKKSDIKNSPLATKTNVAARLINPLYFLPYAICHHADSTHQVVKMKVCFLPVVAKPNFSCSLSSSTSSLKLSSNSRFVRVIAVPSAWKSAGLSMSAAPGAGNETNGAMSDLFGGNGFGSDEKIIFSENVAADKLRFLFGMEGKAVPKSKGKK